MRARVISRTKRVKLSASWARGFRRPGSVSLRDRALDTLGQLGRSIGHISAQALELLLCLEALVREGVDRLMAKVRFLENQG